MQKFIRTLFLVLVSIATANLHSQNITFNHLTTDDGLSQFSVNSLYIDENGILWIGTREGLNRYNGNDIQTYKLTHAGSFPESYHPGIPADRVPERRRPDTYSRN